MIDLDHRVQHWVVLHRTGWLSPLFEAASWLGSWGAVWLTLGLVAALARGTGRPPGGPVTGRAPGAGQGWRVLRRLRSGRWDALVAAVLAVLLAEAVAALLKLAIHRHRPVAGLAGPAPLVHVPHSSAFPSSHATVAFAGATALALTLTRAAAALPLLLLAAAVAYSRVYVGVHWPADVVAGAVVGAPLGTAAWWLAPRARAACARWLAQRG